MDEELKRYRPSECVEYDPNVSAEFRLALQMGVAELDRVHFLPRNIPVRIALNRRRADQGLYDPRTSGIELSRYGYDMVGTFLHEFGHFLDNRILHRLSRHYASFYEPDLQNLMSRCLGSRPLRNIEGILRRSRNVPRSIVRYLREATQPHEVFARAYMQWVCVKSSNPTLAASLALRKVPISVFDLPSFALQWELEEFADIMLEFDLLFRNKGLL